jgi:hypothetical protein
MLALAIEFSRSEVANARPPKEGEEVRVLKARTLRTEQCAPPVSLPTLRVPPPEGLVLAWLGEIRRWNNQWID